MVRGVGADGAIAQPVEQSGAVAGASKGRGQHVAQAVRAVVLGLVEHQVMGAHLGIHLLPAGRRGGDLGQRQLPGDVHHVGPCAGQPR